jgi:cell wall-associated NlpC family hydrolase
MFTPVVNLAPIVGDFVDVAEKFVGTPYLWGGRSAFGLDCSGLVQIALQAVGVDAPRDSDMQQAELGEGVKDSLTRGDLVILDGHVGIMLNGENVLHANVHHMAVVSEPLADVILRVGEVVERRRLTTD